MMMMGVRRFILWQYTNINCLISGIVQNISWGQNLTTSYIFTSHEFVLYHDSWHHLPVFVSGNNLMAQITEIMIYNIKYKCTKISTFFFYNRINFKLLGLYDFRRIKRMLHFILSVSQTKRGKTEVRQSRRGDGERRDRVSSWGWKRGGTKVSN